MPTWSASPAKPRAPRRPVSTACPASFSAKSSRSRARRRRNISPTLSGAPPPNTPNAASSPPRRTPADCAEDDVSEGVLKRVRTQTLEIAYEESGPADGTPVLLMHGFPYDVRAYDQVVPLLVAAG